MRRDVHDNHRFFALRFIHNWSRFRFSAEKIDVEMDGGPWFVPGSAINELRREALDALLKKLSLIHI